MADECTLPLFVILMNDDDDIIEGGLLGCISVLQLTVDSAGDIEQLVLLDVAGKLWPQPSMVMPVDDVGCAPLGIIGKLWPQPSM